MINVILLKITYVIEIFMDISQLSLSPPSDFIDVELETPVLSYSQFIYKAFSFDKYIYPFTQILTEATDSFFKNSFKLINFTVRCFSAIDVVVHRLIYAPSFDPTHPSFEKLIDRLNTYAPVLQKRIDQLEHKFWKDHLISDDLEELRTLSDEIFRIYWQLNGYTTALEKRVNPFPIQVKLTKVRDVFRQLDDQLDDFCLEKGEGVLKKFHRIAELFSKGANELTEDIRKQFIQIWENLDRVFTDRIQNQSSSSLKNSFMLQLGDIEDLVNYVKNTSKNPLSSIHYHTPLKLSNIGNSCYMDSVLECILCIDHIRKEFSSPLEKNEKTTEEYKSEVAIQQEILKFIDSQQDVKAGKQLSQMELILYLLGGGASLHRLREAIFKSGFQPELEMSSLKNQHDAAYIMELLIDHLLPGCKYYSHEYSTTDSFPGLVFPTHGADVTNTLLHVSLRHKESLQNLASLVRLTIDKRREKESKLESQREFDPKKGIVIQGKEESAALVSAADPKKVEEYVHWDRLTKLPPVLTIQFKRFSYEGKLNDNGVYVGVTKKDDRPVILPEDGILDLSKYYDAPEGEPKGARYKVKSMVRHLGGSSANSGHYVAEVEINGKYFHCNDLHGYKEISKEKFLGHKDPYLLFLERIPD